jgi:Cof subfamily protein (haloacid dehalogenase superfamily)
VASLRKHGLDVWVYAGEDWIIPNADAPHVAREQWTVKFAPKVSADIDAALDHAVKIVGVSDDLAAVEKAEHDLQAELGDAASAARSQPYYLDVTNAHANKGDVVLTLSKRLGIPVAEIATFGDQPNDVLMFRQAGVSIAMGQANDEVKHAATHVTDDSENEGFAKGVERFILGLLA